MISLHAHEAQDWSGNGICALFPEVCDVKEMAAGLYELELIHPITDDGRALSIKNGMLIKAPVPARETPLITNWHEGNDGQPGHVIYETNITTGQTGGYVRIYTKADSSSKVLQKLRNHVEFIFHSNVGSNWVKGTSAEGTTGYLYKPNVRYVRTEIEIPGTPGYNSVVLPRQIREQLFRVYDVDTDTEPNKVKALARHIFYDQLGNFVKTYNPKDVPLQDALDAMSADLINSHDYDFYTNITRSIAAEWALKNVVQAILDPEVGAAAKLKAQVVRDNYDTFLLENTEIDRGVVIEAGKNLLGVKGKVNDESVITRIMPYGTDKAGKILLLPEVYLDSQYKDNYPTIRAYPLQVQDAVEKDASGDNPAVTKEQAYEKMRQAAQEMFDAGCDLPNIDIQVDFVHLGDTIEYAQYKDLQQVFLYDTVTVKHGRLGMLYKTQVIGYDFDAALGRYNGVTLGNIKNGAELGVIAGFQLPNGGISGMKLVPGSVGSGQLRELSILAAHIGLAQIVNAHIQDATIDKAKVKDFTAEVAAIAVAKIGEAWIDAAWIDQLTANVVSIVTANIDTLITNNANINWAQIANLVAAVADITLAQIQTANIGWAQIGGLVAGTALFTQGVSGQLYCSELMVTDANIETLSANKIAGGLGVFGKIMIMGQDGKMYELVVGSLGELTAQEKKLDGDNIGDYVLTDRNMSNGTLTARTLNVQQIFGDSALVRQLIAQSIDTDTLFANFGYINALRTYLIQSDIGQYLNLQSNTGIQLLVDNAVGPVEEKAEDAKTAANAANNKLDDIASDSKLTPVEKQSTKQEWDVIAGEKPKIDAQADTYGVAKTAYGTAYNNLSTYITPLLADLSVTSNITGATFRATFKAYYDARQDLLNNISAKAKTMADVAQAMATGNLLYHDPTFAAGINDVDVYNNAGNGNVGIFRIERAAIVATPPTASPYLLMVKHTGAAAPGLGGIVQYITSRPSAVFVIKYLILLPVGYKLNIASNEMGTGFSDQFITPADGTGWWAEYIRVVKCGSTGTFSVGGHLYVTGPTPTPDNHLNWFIGAIYAYDATDASYLHSQVALLPGQITIAINKADAAQGTANGAYQKVAGIDILPDGVHTYGKQFDVRDVVGADPAFIVDAVAKIVKALSAQFSNLTLNGPLTGSGHNVLLKRDFGTYTLYPGANSSTNQAIINGAPKYLEGDVTFYLAAGTHNGTLVFPGFVGRGELTVKLASGVNLNGWLEFYNCSRVYLVGEGGADVNAYSKIISPSNDFCVFAYATNIDIRYLRCTGRVRTGTVYGQGTSTGIALRRFCKASVKDCIVERTLYYAVDVAESSDAFIYNVIGGQAGGDYNTLANLYAGVANRENSVVTVSTAIPIAGGAHLLNENAPAAFGTATPTGSPGAHTPPTQYSAQYVYNSGRWCDLPANSNMNTVSSGWSSGPARGGLWNAQNQRYTGMWLLQRNGGGVENILTLLAGRTVISATLRIHCADCWSGSAIHDLYFMTVGSLPGSSQAPSSFLADSGIDITLVQGQDTIVNVTAFVQSRLASSAPFYGFGLGLAGQYAKMDTTCILDIVYQ